ncbi:MAG: cupin domain-containing protein [Cupriavidus necator]
MNTVLLLLSTRRALFPLVLVCASASMAQSLAAGFDVKVLGTIKLGPQLGLPTHALEMNYVPVAPGASLPVDPHTARPEIIYVLQGQLTEVRNGVTSDHGTGDVLLLTRDISHGLANRSNAPAVFLAAPVAKQQ